MIQRKRKNANFKYNWNIAPTINSSLVLTESEDTSLNTNVRIFAYESLGEYISFLMSELLYTKKKIKASICWVVLSYAFLHLTRDETGEV